MVPENLDKTSAAEMMFLFFDFLDYNECGMGRAGEIGIEWHITTVT